MTKFEQIGVNLQYDSTSKEQAKKCFKYSCDTCCYRGMHIDCDHCAIAAVHSLIVATFEELEDK